MALEGMVTALEPQRHDPERLNVYLDGRFAFGLSAKVALEAGLVAGSYLPPNQVAVLLQFEEREAALRAALLYLSYRARSEQEVRRYLAGRGYAEGTITAVVERLTSYHYVDDRHFALAWVENRQRFRPRGERLLRAELLQKGVDREVVQRAIEDASEDQQKLARVAAEKKIRSLHGVDEVTFRRRLGGFLLRRGFDLDVAQTVVQQMWGAIQHDSANLDARRAHGEGEV